MCPPWQTLTKLPPWEISFTPLTGGITTVQSFIVDPVGTSTAGSTAFVQTADGYIFIVKGVGEQIYNSDIPLVLHS